jgi:plastocyanin
MTANHVDRRTMLKSTGAALAGVALAGCIGDSEPTDGSDGNDGNGGDTDGGGDGNGGGGNTVAAGPDGELVFDPEEITVSVGDTVTWEFVSPGHNVYAYDDQEDVSLPDGAEGFGSVEKGDQFGTNSQGDTFEYTFETAGTYEYVCVPHVASGMVGTVVVEE